MNSKIKYFLITAVLATAILCFGTIPNITKAACSAGNEITCQINALMDQIKALQAQIAQLQAQQTPIQWCHTFNTNLKLGDSGAEVLALDKTLEKEGFSVNEQKDNPPFAEPTASAVTGFQEKYASEILTPLGLKYGTGYFGPATRKKLNALYGCAVTPACSYLYWIDNNDKTCATTKQFCGAYMYYGLQTFKTQQDCLNATGIVCAQDMYTCPNGVSVSRTGPNCQFVCPPTQCATVNNHCGSPGPIECCPGLTCQLYNIPGLDGGTCVSSTTQPSITINSVSGPNSLNIGQTGTWAVNATAPAGTTLTYSVDWGEVPQLFGGTGVALPAVSQLTTFTHVYNYAGTYTIKFRVSAQNASQCAIEGDVNGCISGTNYAQTSITVVVGSAAQCYTDADCPSACPACAGGPSASCGGPCYTYKCVSGKCVANTQPSITSISPTSGAPGTLVTIYGSNIGNTIGVEFSSNVFAPATARDFPVVAKNNTSVTFIVPSTFNVGESSSPLPPGIYNVSVVNSSISSNSLPFTVTSSSTQPSITVTSPNGGESLIVGRPLTINWNTTGFSSSDSVQISLYDSSMNCGSIPAPGCWTTFPLVWNGVKNTGSYTWDTNTYFGDPGPYNPLYLSQHISTGAVYKIKLDIVGSNSAKATDYSDNYFSIIVPLF